MSSSSGLEAADKDALTILKGQLAAIRKVKQSAKAGKPA